jgi:molecular chaperone DnaJ
LSTMAKRDYYEILGVSKKANAEEIKKSFRNKARHLHPDNKESGDEAAFKELAEAYEVLSDDGQRATYDRYGHEGVKNTARGFDNVDFSNFAGFGIDDLIDMFFGGGVRTGRQGGPEQGSHLRYELQIDFMEAVFGVEKKLSIRRLEDCTTCSGSGATPGSEIKQCTTCAGMGQVQQVFNSFFGQSIRVTACPTCQGIGSQIEKPCRECRGEGLLRRNRDFDVKIPAGIESGSRVRLTAGGDKGKRGGPFGDLFVVVSVREHETFIRDGLTIHVKQPITFSMAALGGELLVETVNGKKLVKVPAGTQAGAAVVLKELGVPRLNNPARRGDQVVHLIVETPKKLSSEEKKLLEKLAELRGESLHVSNEEIERLKAESKAAQDREAESAPKPEEKPKKPETSTTFENSTNEPKDDHSIFEKIGEFFKPKNGEHEAK